MIPITQNIVSTANLDCDLNLHYIAMRVQNVEYSSKKFSALILRIRNPKTTCLVFKNGRIVCTGGKTEKESKLAARKFGRLVQKVGFNVSFKDFKIQNIVASCSMGFSVDLASLASEYSHICTYEPEIFPGCKLVLKSTRTTQLIFSSGKIVFTGAKAKEDLLRAFKIVQKILVNFKKSK